MKSITFPGNIYIVLCYVFSLPMRCTIRRSDHKMMMAMQHKRSSAPVGDRCSKTKRERIKVRKKPPALWMNNMVSLCQIEV